MKSFVVFLELIAIACAAPSQERIETNPMLIGGYFEGDIILDAAGRNGIKNTTKRWPNNTVYYKVADACHHLDENIDLAMRNIEKVSCIQFKEATTDTKGYTLIKCEVFGCYANGGYDGNEQITNFGKDCNYVSIIVHELLHNLGFLHMQNDPHRDDFVRIDEENIIPGYESNFEKHSEDKLGDYGLGYDYASIMHYPANAFSKNEKDTIVALKKIPEGVVMGGQNHMSEKDIKKLNIMYECPALI